MGLGAVTCMTDQKDSIVKHIRSLKPKYGQSRDFEIKWLKVSQSKVDFYIDVLNYYFDNDHLGSKCVKIDKTKLYNEKSKTFHYEFYYEMTGKVIKNC